MYALIQHVVKNARVQVGFWSLTIMFQGLGCNSYFQYERLSQDSKGVEIQTLDEMCDPNTDTILTIFNKIKMKNEHWE